MSCQTHKTRVIFETQIMISWEISASSVKVSSTKMLMLHKDHKEIVKVIHMNQVVQSKSSEDTSVLIFNI